MTLADITKMAREAGATPYTNRHFPEMPFHTFSPEQLERFFTALIASERDECAKVCEGMARRAGGDIRTAALEVAAENIRTRSQ